MGGVRRRGFTPIELLVVGSIARGLNVMFVDGHAALIFGDPRSEYR